VHVVDFNYKVYYWNHAGGREPQILPSRAAYGPRAGCWSALLYCKEWLYYRRGGGSMYQTLTSRKTVSLRLTDTLSPTPWGRLGRGNANLQLCSASLLCIWAVNVIHWSLNVSEQWTSWESRSGYFVEKFHVFHGTPLFTRFAYRSAFYIFTYLLTCLLHWEANRFAASQEIPRILWN
jgi:hypothetical protein